jgi:PIN domain nuclease of toxin-antitoxin system
MDAQVACHRQPLRGTLENGCHIGGGNAELDATRVRGLLGAAGVRIEPLTAGDAELAGSMRSLGGGRTLSLGDRCCLALTVRSDPPDVLTADRAWSELDLPIRVHLIR